MSTLLDSGPVTLMGREGQDGHDRKELESKSAVLQVKDIPKKQKGKHRQE